MNNIDCLHQDAAGRDGWRGLIRGHPRNPENSQVPTPKTERSSIRLSRAPRNPPPPRPATSLVSCKQRTAVRGARRQGSNRHRHPPTASPPPTCRPSHQRHAATALPRCPIWQSSDPPSPRAAARTTAPTHRPTLLPGFHTRTPSPITTAAPPTIHPSIPLRTFAELQTCPPASPPTSLPSYPCMHAPRPPGDSPARTKRGGGGGGVGQRTAKEAGGPACMHATYVPTCLVV